MDVVATAAPWSALVVATSLPYRFLQVVFFERLAELGGKAIHYGQALTMIANATLLAFIVSRCGRAVFARACRLAEASGTMPGRAALRVPAVALVSYVFVAALAEVLYYAGALTFVGPILAAMLSGLAIGTMELNTRPGLMPPLRVIARYSRTSKQLLALLFVFTIATLIAFINLFSVFQMGLWLAHAFSSVDLSRWEVLLSGSNGHFMFLLIAGAIAAVEPFWIAAHVVLVRKAGVAESGEDLRDWFRDLRSRWTL